MPYATNAQLPDPIRRHLPGDAQNIYRAAFNAAFARYGSAREATAHRIAWAAVKRRYVRRGVGVWSLRRKRAPDHARN
jgi:cation transport regulator